MTIKGTSQRDTEKQIRVEESDLIGKEVSFPFFKFSTKGNFQENDPDKKEGFVQLPVPLGVAVQWKLSAVRRDNQGIIIGCMFKIYQGKKEIEVHGETMLKFKKKFPEEQFLNTCFFQVLVAKITFPYLAELVVTNTAKMGPLSSPILLDSGLLEKIIEETNRQGPFSRNVNSN